jgi:hypothetical protein
VSGLFASLRNKNLPVLFLLPNNQLLRYYYDSFIMAPDLNAVSGDGKWDYSTPGSTGYDVQNITYDVSNVTMRMDNVLTFLGPQKSQTESDHNWRWILWNIDGIPNPEIL